MAKYVNLDDSEVIYCGSDGDYEKYNIPYDMPFADVVERKKGKWVGVKIGNGDTRYTCSECGASYECDSRDRWDFNFCPHCGTQMCEGSENAEVH